MADFIEYPGARVGKKERKEDEQEISVCPWGGKRNGGPKPLVAKLCIYQGTWKR